MDDDYENSIRLRPVQALPEQRSKKEGVPEASVKDFVPKGLADKTHQHHGDIINYLGRIVMGVFF